MLHLYDLGFLETDTSTYPGRVVKNEPDCVWERVKGLCYSKHYGDDISLGEFIDLDQTHRAPDDIPTHMHISLDLESVTILRATPFQNASQGGRFTRNIWLTEMKDNEAEPKMKDNEAEPKMKDKEAAEATKDKVESVQLPRELKDEEECLVAALEKKLLIE